MARFRKVERCEEYIADKPECEQPQGDATRAGGNLGNGASQLDEDDQVIGHRGTAET